MSNNKINLVNNDSIVKNKIVNHYNNLLPDDSLALHFGFYERGVRTLSDAELNMNNYIGRLLDLDTLGTTDSKILDAGCGVGGTSIYLAKKYRNIKFVGITLVPRQVDLANKFALEKGVSTNTEFILGDYCETGLPDNSFSHVFAIESACYSTDKKRFIQEVARVLKSNGKFVILDGFVRGKKSNYFVQVAYRYYCDGWAVSDFIVIDEFLSHLKDVGFDDVKVRDITNNILLFMLIGWFRGLAYFLFATPSKKRKKKKSSNKNPFTYFIIKVFSPILILLSHKLRYIAITSVKKPK